MAKYPGDLLPLYVNTVRAGEAAGSLDRVLNYLADYVERDMELIQRIKTAAAYPSVVMGLAIAVGLGAVFFVLPTITTLFDTLKVTLPCRPRSSSRSARGRRSTGTSASPCFSRSWAPSRRCGARTAGGASWTWCC